jgi:hypothetical protein
MSIVSQIMLLFNTEDVETGRINKQEI